MCGLFGFSACDDFVGADELSLSLASQSAIRGTDATGFAFNKNGKLNILKAAKAGDLFEFKHPIGAKVLIGHTRHGTQGSEEKNYNNHPFWGKTKNAKFALAHNGVLINDDTLQKELRLPKTKIETDSYVAVQLIESKKKLDFNTIKYMAENVEGSFSFSILDDKNNLYLVKGDSPLSVLYFQKHKIYVYASTDEILYKALVDSKLFSSLKKGEYEELPIDEGEILKISADGSLERQRFNYRYYYGKGWWQYGITKDFEQSVNPHIETDYIDELKRVAVFEGYDPDMVDRLLKDGFDPIEIEGYLYGYVY